METVKFKTTIKCAGCIEKVTPFLNNAVGTSNWQVDVQDPGKTLTVTTQPNITEQDIVKAVEAAGYKAEKLQQG